MSYWKQELLTLCPMFPVSLNCPFMITFFSVDGIISMTFFFIPTFFVPTVVRNVSHNHVRHDIVSGRGISCKNKCSLDSFILLTSVQVIISLCPVLWIFVMVKNIWNYIWGTELYMKNYPLDTLSLWKYVH